MSSIVHTADAIDARPYISRGDERFGTTRNLHCKDQPQLAKYTGLADWFTADRLAKCTGLTGANTNDSALFLLAVTNFHPFPQNSFPFQTRNNGGRVIGG